MRWHYRDPLLVWLLPLAFGCHLVEEWVGGSAFITINTVAFALFVAAAQGATTREARGWMGIAMAMVLLVNAHAHVLGTLVFGSYSPGLITSVVLYLPLSQLVLLRAWYQADGASFTPGLLAGLALHALLAPLVFAVTR